MILEPVGLLAYIPRQEDQVFAEWWRKARKHPDDKKRKGLNTLIIWAHGRYGNTETCVCLKMAGLASK
ncbi:hypothetical protein HU200_059986 [Digitaria exilis]|uniref:Uncharacterized protein n=1 Tax=Digitaria exilis TaxID=1010633 RepID=A0A835E2N5_9POAL|nr:hypothetical protein HU200_059986 [Digitaria exilis]